MRTAPCIQLTDRERNLLQRWARSRTVEVRLVLRAQIVLRAADGATNKEIAADLGTSTKTVALWRSRFREGRLAAIQKDAPRTGRPPSISPETIREILRKTVHESPADKSHWSVRSLAKVVGVSHSTVQRVWQAHGLTPLRETRREAAAPPDATQT